MKDEKTQLIENKADMNIARLRLDNAAGNANASVDTIAGKVEELKKTRIAVEVDPNEWLASPTSACSSSREWTARLKSTASNCPTS